MRSVPISHSITGPLARSIGLGCTGAEREKALTNAGGLSGPPLGVHYNPPHPPPQGNVPPTRARAGGQVRPAHPAGGNHGLLDETATIGAREGWQRRLAERGLTVRGHRLVRRRGEKGEEVEPRN